MSLAEPRDGRVQLMEPTERCHVDRLPAELLQLVLSQLQLRQLLQVQLVSRRWRDAVFGLLCRRQELDLSHSRSRWWCADDTLRRLLRLMPALRVLRLYSRSDHALDIIATHCKYLAKIHFDGFDITDASARKLCAACPSLEVVKSDSFSEGSLRVLLRHSPALRELDLSDSGVTGQCFSLLPGSLQRLSVAYCGSLHSETLRQVGARCPQLRQLDVSGLQGLHVCDLAAALAGCPQLERLTASELLVPPERCLPPGGLPALRQLAVGGSTRDVTDTTLRQLPDLLPRLQTLIIARCNAVTGQGLQHLQRFKQLLSLNLSDLFHVTDAVLDQLHGMPLKELILRDAAVSMLLTAEAVARLAVSCPSLTRIVITFSRRLVPGVVDLLHRDLPVSRDVTLVVEAWLGVMKEKPPPQPASSPLRVVFD